MARRASVTRLPEPGQIHVHITEAPGWVRHWPGVFVRTDEARQAVQRQGHRNWRVARDEWREKWTGVDAATFAHATDREWRRRHPVVDRPSRPGRHVEG